MAKLDGLVAKRLKAAKLLRSGHTAEAVSNKLGFSLPTVLRYQFLLQSGGLSALESLRTGGRPPILDDAARAWVAFALKGTPAKHGFHSKLWNSAQLGEVIKREFGVSFSRVYVRQMAISLGYGHRLRKMQHTAGSGACPALDATDMAKLAAILKRSPRKAGFDVDRWTNRHVRQAILNRFNVEYSRVHVWKLVKRLGLSHFVGPLHKHS